MNCSHAVLDMMLTGWTLCERNSTIMPGEVKQASVLNRILIDGTERQDGFHWLFSVWNEHVGWAEVWNRKERLVRISARCVIIALEESWKESPRG